MSSIVILISGQQGSGKSSTQKELTKLCRMEGLEPIPLAFADPLYEMHDKCLSILNDFGIKTPKKDGPLLQMLGTDWGRKIYGDNLWCDIAKNRVEDFCNQDFYKNKKTVFIFSDARFPSELETFPNALKFRLECPENIRRERILLTPGQSWRENTNHPSETALSNYSPWHGVFNTEILPTNYIVQEMIKQIEIEFQIMGVK